MVLDPATDELVAEQLLLVRREVDDTRGEVAAAAWREGAPEPVPDPKF